MLSPLLFDVFINDFLCGLGGGVAISGVVENCNGLLYADDSCMLASSVIEMQNMLENAEKWSVDNGMKFNVKKCGFFMVGDQEDRQLLLNGEVVPKVDEYKYLGVMMDNSMDLNFSREANRRKKSTKNLIRMMTLFLGNKRIPPLVKSTLVKAKLLPVALWSSELWGGNKVLSWSVQVSLNKALRFVGSYSKGASINAIWKELEVPPIFATSSARRIRVAMKWKFQNSWIGLLLSNSIIPGRKLTWCKGSWRMVKKHVPLDDMNLDCQLIKDNVQGIIWCSLVSK